MPRQDSASKSVPALISHVAAECPKEMKDIIKSTSSDDAKKLARRGAFRGGLRRCPKMLPADRSTTTSVDCRNALDRLPKLASELVDTRPDVIVAVTTPTVAAVQRSTHTVPIVMAVVLDPVGSGFAKSLAYPGSNITGPSGYLGDLTGKRIQLFKELLPELSILGILWNKGNYISTRVVQSAVEVASPLGISLKSLPIQAPAELASLLDRASKENLNGLFVAGDPLLFDRRADIIAFSIANRIPTFHTWPDEAVDGAFAAYGYRLSDDYRRAAYYVDKILKGAAPSELPIDQPTRFELVLNIKTAKSIGVAIPLSVLSTADELIN
jgi:putative tryptophan/tyrosine transport system substrate-binding protein